MELAVGLVRVPRKGSPLVSGNYMMDLMCGSMELRCSSLLT